MSTDYKVTKDLIETLQDGKDGYAHAAERLADSDRPDLSQKMRAYADQRAAFSAELETLAAAYGDDVDEEGSGLAAAHRAWMSLKDTITGADPQGVLSAAEQGEDHAVATYESALSKEISPDLRITIQRQFDDVKRAHDDIRALRNAFAA